MGLLRSHTTDKWCFGFARLIEGSDRDKVNFVTELGLPAGSTLGGNPLLKAEVVVFQATTNDTNAVTGRASAVTLPVDFTDYNYIHVTEYDTATNQWRHSEIATAPFAAGHVGPSDNVRLQGNTVMNWVSASRQLAMNPLVLEIYRLSLKD